MSQAAAKFRNCPYRDDRIVVLRRIRVEPKEWGSTGHTYYETHDGRFRVTSTYNRTGSAWQVRAMDDSTPFRGFGGKRNSGIFNAYTLDECRDEITYAYDREQPGE